MAVLTVISNVPLTFHDHFSLRSEWSFQTQKLHSSTTGPQQK